MPRAYVANSSDSINSIAFENGFLWETLWNDGANAELKSQRKDPDVLKAGDVVHIPDLTIKEESAATEEKHTFKLKGVPVKLVLVLRRTAMKKSEERVREPSGGDAWDFKEVKPEPLPDEPDANAPYVLYADGKQVVKGETDADGRLEGKSWRETRNGTLGLH